VFASAGVAGYLMSLSTDVFQHALGAAASFACGILEPMDAGSMEWKFTAGVATNNGIVAAQMARKGLTAAPTALEGRFGFYQAFCGATGTPPAFVEGPGRRYQIMDNWHKPFPTGSESTWVSAMKLVQGIVRRKDIDHRRISAIVVRVMGRMLSYPDLTFSGVCETIDKAIMSKPFAVAAIVKNKTLNYAVYRDQLNDAALYEIAKKVRVEPLSAPSWDKFNAEADAGRHRASRRSRRPRPHPILPQPQARRGKLHGVDGRTDPSGEKEADRRSGLPPRGDEGHI
jgi:2-methylcitrate dehydratase PrpD